MRKVWLYTLAEDYTFYHKNLLGVEFADPWLNISGGWATITKGYASDGCSPKFKVLNRWVWGVSDGPEMENGLRQTYWAFFSHDALTQFQKDMGLPSNLITQVFKDHLLEAKWKHTDAYVNSVASYMFIRDGMRMILHPRNNV